MIGAHIGAYTIVRSLGAGGMGSVWMAEHGSLGRKAAIKVLHPAFSHQPEIVARFFNEARAATAISDPGIVQIFDFGHHTDGTAYIVMELLEGEPLSERLARHGCLPVGDALRIMRQVASSLGAAHARGITHRDLKPENIYLVRDPEVAGGERPKLLDFGIAKLTAEHGGVKTQTSAVMGTPTFMSPEQCRGAGHVDQRSDVYSLGCVLFQLITSRPPFEAEGIGEIIAMHLREPPPTVSSRMPGIPQEVDQLVATCLAKDPQARFPSGSELAAALAALVARISIAGVSAPVGPHDSHPAMFRPATSPTTLSASSGTVTGGAAGKPRSRVKWITAAVVVAGAGAGVVIGATRAADDGPEGAVVQAPGGEPAAQGPAAGTAPAGSAAAPATAAAPAVTPAAASAPPPPPAPPDPSAQARPRLAGVLTAFGAWAAGHAGEPCPAASALVPDAGDPWGTPIELTCTDQPANQIAGATSAGPDKKIGTGDDISSWMLGREVTELVRGPRWVVAAKPAERRPARTSRPATRTDPVGQARPAARDGARPAAPPEPPASSIVDIDGDGIPDKR